MAYSSKPWLSILIPVYNVADYLQECLDSVLAQVIPGVEIIALDDCSTDNSLEQLKRIAGSAKIPINIWNSSTAEASAANICCM